MNEIELKERSKGALPALGFGTTVFMWAVAYVCRFPSVAAPGWLTVILMMLSLAGGGYLAGRLTGRGWNAGLKTGLVASILNLLILGSLLAGESPNRVVPSALWWLPGSLIAGALLGAIGGAAGGGKAGPAAERNWNGGFAMVAAAATFLLLIAGGIVTASKAGLAVVDWPNSYGYNMFLYPLAKMSGGIFYEHAHRLLGSLVGLTTLVLTIQIWRLDDRPWLKRFALAALILVVVQGFLGGMRVTGRPTLSDSPEVMAPNILLAIVHGVTGQVFFGFLVAAAIFLSKRWRHSGEPVQAKGASADRTLAAILIVILIGQIVLGAIQRHLAGGLHLHISLAVIVLGFGAASGARAWGLYEGVKPILKAGRSLTILLGAQIVLGILALVAINLSPESGPPSPWDVTITTIHQVVGAALLAHAVMLLLWYYRLVKPAGK